MKNNTVLNQVKDWLKHEVKYHQEIADAKDNKQEAICSDGTDDISYGRHECAEGLLSLIKKWEKQRADTTQKEWIKGYQKWKDDYPKKGDD